MKLPIKLYPRKFFGFLMFYSIILFLGTITFLFFPHTLPSPFFDIYICVLIIGLCIDGILIFLHFSSPMVISETTIFGAFLKDIKNPKSEKKQLQFSEIKSISIRTFSKLAIEFYCLDFLLVTNQVLFLIITPFSEKQRQAIVDLVHSKISAGND